MIQKSFFTFRGPGSVEMVSTFVQTFISRPKILPQRSSRL